MDVLGQHIRTLDQNQATAAVLTSSFCFLLFIVAYYVSSSEDITPVHFKVDLPPQLAHDYPWDLSQTSSKPEIRDGLIYPRCPADGRPLQPEPIKPATKDDIDAAIARATDAQREWAKTSFSTRRKLLNTLLQHVIDHQESIVQAACLDSGKTKIDASFGEILVTVEKLQWTIKHGEKALSPSPRPTNLLMQYKKNYVIYEPLGVVASCFSWNYPFHSWISLVISGLFTGNAVVLKPSEQTCWSSQYFLKIVHGALQTLGHSTDVVQNVICLPETADYLTSHPGISHITFIGSRPVAHKVCASAAKALTPVTVELGGKDPAIVLDDRSTLEKLDSVVSILMRGTFQSAGQNCIGIERIIALPKVYDKLVHKLEMKIKHLRLGSITLHKPGHEDIDVGSMISSVSFGRLEHLISAAVASGARLHTGGKAYAHPLYPNGHYFLPTLISDVTPEMEIAMTELFAPICTVIRAKDVDHAIQLANSTSYGLAASAFGAPTHSNRESLARIAKEVRSGMISINDFGAYYVCSLPFGGVEGSGYGRFGGAEGLQGLCNAKSVCEDARWAQMMGIKTEIPPVLQYPVMATPGYQACEGIVKTGYSPTWVGMLSGITSLVGALTIKKQ